VYHIKYKNNLLYDDINDIFNNQPFFKEKTSSNVEYEVIVDRMSSGIFRIFDSGDLPLTVTYTEQSSRDRTLFHALIEVFEF
jgi:hypothetical protein